MNPEAMHSPRRHYSGLYSSWQSCPFRIHTRLCCVVHSIPIDTERRIGPGGPMKLDLYIQPLPLRCDRQKNCKTGYSESSTPQYAVQAGCQHRPWPRYQRQDHDLILFKRTTSAAIVYVKARPFTPTTGRHCSEHVPTML